MYFFFFNPWPHFSVCPKSLPLESHIFKDQIYISFNQILDPIYYKYDKVCLFTTCALQGVTTKSTALFYHSMAIFAPPIEQKICGLELRYLRKKGKVRAGLSPWANFTNRIRRAEQNWSRVRANKAVLAAAQGTVYWLLNCSLHFFPKNWR